MLAKSKLNSIETLISQALTDIEISHEKFATISKEKDETKNSHQKILFFVCVCIKCRHLASIHGKTAWRQ